MGIHYMPHKQTLFSREELLSSAQESNILVNAAKKARETKLSIDRAKQEEQAWAEVKNKIVGAE